MMGTEVDNPARQATEQRDQLAALYQLALEMAELRDLQQVLDLALHQCLALTASPFGFIGLTAEDGIAMNVVALQGYEVPRRFYEERHLIMPLRSPLLSRAARDGRPIRSPDVKHDERRVGQPRGHPPVRVYLGVPLRLRGQPIGMIGVANRPGGYAEEHERLLMTYAAPVAISIHNAQLYEQLQEVAISEERARLAREMHDSLAQLLFYVNTQAEAVRTLLHAEQTKRAATELEQLAQVARDAYADVREDILALRTAGRPRGLVASLNAYLPLWQEQSGVRAELLVTPAGAPLPLLPAAAEIQVVRIVQEALANVRKHAQARNVQVHIGATVDQLSVVVEDNGVGFDPTLAEQSKAPHFGLTTMHERADAVGGRLMIDAAPGRGTRISVQVPATPVPPDAVGKDGG